MLAALLIHGALALAAVRLSGALPADVGPWLRLATGIAAFHALAVIGATTIGVLGAPTPLAAGIWAWLLALGSLALPQHRSEASPWNDGDVTGLALLAGTLSMWVVRGGTMFTHLSYDDTTYHVAMPAAWLTEGVIHVVPYTYQAYYPLYAELLSFWLMIGNHSLTHVGVAPVLHAFTVATGALALGERLKWTTGLTAALIACLLITRRVSQLAEAATTPDLAATGLVLVATAWLLTASTRRDAVLGGLFAGLALSTKVTTAVPLGVLGLSLLWRNVSLFPWFAGPALVLGSPFYVHNLIVAGNPLFPAASALFDGPFDREAQYATSLRPFLKTPAGVLEVLSTRLNWPAPLGAAIVAGWIAGPVLGARDRDVHRATLAVMGLLAVAVLPFQPFSGTINRPTSELSGIIRFMLPAVSLALLNLSGAYRARWSAVPAILWLVVLGMSLDLTRPWERAVVVAVATATGAAMWKLPSKPRWATRLLVAGLVLTIAIRTPAKRMKTQRDLFGTSRSTLLQAEILHGIDQLPRDSVVALVGDIPVALDHSVRAYGSRLQHRYHAVDLDGRALRPLHERWRDEPDGWFWRFDSATTEDFVDNITQTDVDYLVLTRCNGGRRWPPLRRQLAAFPQRRLFRSGCGEIWKVR